MPGAAPAPLTGPAARGRRAPSAAAHAAPEASFADPSLAAWHGVKTLARRGTRVRLPAERRPGVRFGAPYLAMARRLRARSAPGANRRGRGAVDLAPSVRRAWPPAGGFADAHGRAAPRPGRRGSWWLRSVSTIACANFQPPRLSTDTRVIISAYRIEKSSEDHPYNADSARRATARVLRGRTRRSSDSAPPGPRHVIDLTRHGDLAIADCPRSASVVARRLPELNSARRWSASSAPSITLSRGSMYGHGGCTRLLRSGPGAGFRSWSCGCPPRNSTSSTPIVGPIQVVYEFR